MKRYFITAIGTGIGKTLVASALSHQLRGKGKRVRAVKPVISGFSEDTIGESDSGQLLAAQGMTHAELDALSPWRFAAPLSPDMAAEEEGRSIDFGKLVSFCDRQSDADVLLVEGVGGIMVPLDRDRTVLDWMVALGYPVILVAGSYLGALNHTLMSARMLASSGLILHAVVLCESENPPVPLARMQASLKRFLPENTRVISIARLASCPDLWKYVPDITESLL